MAYGPIGVTVKVTYSDGSPAGDAVITLQNGNYTDFYIASTDASGTCSLNGVRPNSSALRALVDKNSGGMALNATSVWYEAQNDTLIEVRLPDTGIVAGQVLLDGAPAKSSIVVLDDNATYTAGQDDGRFSFRAAVGNHSLYAAYYSDGTIYASDRQAILVKSGADKAYTLELGQSAINASSLSKIAYDRLFPAHTTGVPFNLSGSVIGADGSPVANATVVAESYFAEPGGVTITGEDGSFSFNGVSVGTDTVRFKVSVKDNGTDYASYSSFYPSADTSGLSIQFANYPESTHGYIYGIITMSRNWTDSMPLNGTVYLSNGMSQEVSFDRNFGQFFFTVPPGVYEIYAVHYDGSDRYTSDPQRVYVDASWTATSANPTLLVVSLNQVYWEPLLVAMLLGLLCLAGTYVLLRKRL
jgi:hypothetical protein